MGITFTVIATQARDIQSLRVDEGLDGSEGQLTETLQTSSAALHSGNLYNKASFIGIYRGQSAPAALQTASHYNRHFKGAS